MANPNGEASRIRDPEFLVSKWTRKNKAFLIDRASNPTIYNIQTTSPNGTADIDVVRQDTFAQPLSPNSPRFSLDWFLRVQRGDNPDVARLVYNIIHISCLPTPGPHNNGREMRPYSDMLFPGGELELSVVADDVEVEAQHKFNIGRVMGLSIVTPTQNYPVWSLEA